MSKRFALLLLIPLFLTSCGDSSSLKYSYGVFLGLDHYESKLSQYEEIVIDVAEWSSSDIQKLKDHGQTVYSYLSIGSLENYRDYYQTFQDHVLGSYENWPDEYWMDVSYVPWQEKITSLAQELVSKGADGFFLDNSDVYYFYPQQKIRDGLDAIYQNLQQFHIPLITNGGDSYVSSLMERNKTSWIYAVNQESVFSSIQDYDNDVFAPQSEEDNAYFKEYLTQCHDKQLSVYLLEYTKDKSIIKQIKNYCATKGYAYYISAHVDLI